MRFVLLIALVALIGGCANVNFISGDGDIYDGEDTSKIGKP